MQKVSHPILQPLVLNRALEKLIKLNNDIKKTHV
jgi:hypothetical protein